jgi:hypothetical protein
MNETATLDPGELRERLEGLSRRFAELRGRL